MTPSRLAARFLPATSLAILAAIAGLAMGGCTPSSNTAANVDTGNTESAMAASSSSSDTGSMAPSDASATMSSAASSAAPANQ